MTDTEESTELFRAPTLPITTLPAVSAVADVPLEPIETTMPAPSMSLAAPKLQYTPPPWACQPDDSLGYKIEVLKNGSIVETVCMEVRANPTFFVVGRLPNCDVQLEHPSISRYHCILQYGEDTMNKSGKGWHVYDMGSTHGSKMNKKRLPPKQYIRVHVGFVFQFGGSSRILSLIGPETDSEAEWECSPTEMKEKIHKKALDAKLAAAARKEIEEEAARDAEDEGISWGMDYGEDEGRAPVMELEGHLAEDGDAFYNADPKKALAKFFEREGFDMEFEYTETGSGHNHKWICSIELPIEIDGIDRAFTAQATVSTSKKDGAVQCALEACRILDKHGVLRKSNTKSRLKKKTLAENDYYDEDDDLYLDRTGQLEEQREKRRQWATHPGGKAPVQKDTYESLCSRLESTRSELALIQNQLDQLSTPSAKKEATSGDSLDDYLNQLSEVGAVDDLKTKTQKSVLRQKLVALTHESQKLEKLARIAKPSALPTLTVNVGGAKAGADKQAFLRKMMMMGRKKKDDTSDVNPTTVSIPSKAAIPTPMMPSTTEEFLPENDDDDAEAEESEATSTASKPSAPMTVDSKDLPDSPSKKAAAESKTPTRADEGKEVSNAFTPVEKLKPDAVSEGLEAEVVHVDTASDGRKRPASDDPPTSSADAELDEEVDDSSTATTTKKKRVRVRNRDRESKKDGGKLEEYGVGCETRDEQYATWMPPENQSGDGKTKLHDKFGGRY